ncbi:hypothetical protein VSR01_22850 [Actinacidiphila sp. DG2A-62]|uniref:hypothetical protein n=1 Tax=Actinacidiphila sp. DG2A-62 TaxID=3108821 RepID=UPI002DBD039A|nr:hypothetical protein [Actinacidiphila sp. DG2A-62]MEC3996201.1 hypothetical protein [Actinacidiphila sp. DG2A-62]
MNGFGGVERLRQLTHLAFHRARRPLSRADWALLADLPELWSLPASSPDPVFDVSFPPLPGIRRLQVSARDDDAQFAPLPELFPGLTHLTVTAPFGSAPPFVDLSPLAALPELTRVVVQDPPPGLTLLNADALAADVEIRPRPRA